MAAMSSSTSCLPDPDEDFLCPICRDIFQTPVIVSECRHIFCRKCFLTSIKVSGCYCPMCRGPINRKERTFPTRSTEKEEEMRKNLTKCKSCGKLKKYYLMRRHYRTCSQYKEEFGNKMDKVKLKKRNSQNLALASEMANEPPRGEQP